MDVAANTYAYPAWFNSMSAFIPPWAHDGGDEQAAARLKDPATRARIRREMLDARRRAGTTSGRRFPGPRPSLIGVVQNPELRALQGKTLAQIAAQWKSDPIDTLFDILIKDQAFT